MSAKKPVDQREWEQHCNRIHHRVGELMKEQGEPSCGGCVAVQLLKEERERWELEVEILEDKR